MYARARFQHLSYSNFADQLTESEIGQRGACTLKKEIVKYVPTVPVITLIYGINTHSLAKINRFKRLIRSRKAHTFASLAAILYVLAHCPKKKNHLGQIL